MEHQIETHSAIGFKRVSSTKQGLQGDSKEDQEIQIRRRAEQLSGILNCKIEFVKFFDYSESASGEFDVQPILKALEYCKDPKHKIKYAFIKSIDRGTRAGATVYGQLKAQFTRYGVQLVDVYGLIGTQSVNTLSHLGVKYPWSEFSPTWISELLEAERAKGEVRDILTRLISAEIRYVRLGYRVRPAPPGYKNIKVETAHGMRVVLAPHEVEAPWFIRMFELRCQENLSDLQIVEQINNLGYRSRVRKVHDSQDKTRIIGRKGAIKLTVKQFQKYVQNPIYAGVNTESWTEGKPIKEKFEGLVTIETFNKANHGKVVIMEDGNEVLIYKGTVPAWRVRKNKNNPNYPYKRYVTCPFCRNPLLGSASRGKSGKYHPAYHCNRGHYFRIPQGEFNTTINNFTDKVEFTDQFIRDFWGKFTEEWDKREKNASNDTVSSNQRLIEIEHEIYGIKEKVKAVELPTTIKLLESDITKLEIEKTNLINFRGKKEEEQISAQVLLAYTKYYMEHLKELLMGSDNPHQNAAMFGLIFEETPTYDELKYGTPNLACIFKLNDGYKETKSLSVSHQGIEP